MVLVSDQRKKYQISLILAALMLGRAHRCVWRHVCSRPSSHKFEEKPSQGQFPVLTANFITFCSLDGAWERGNHRKRGRLPIRSTSVLFRRGSLLLLNQKAVKGCA